MSNCTCALRNVLLVPNISLQVGDKFLNHESILDKTFVKSELNTHSQVTLRIHSSWRKKRRTTKQQMEGQTLIKLEQAWNALYPVAYGAEYK